LRQLSAIASQPVHATIVNVGSRSTNDWVVSAGTSRLLIGTPDDSVSRLLDDGSAFTGDLAPLPSAGDDEAGMLVARSWHEGCIII
jgi:hypothetical protein